jgi:hypothetical protein
MNHLRLLLCSLCLALLAACGGGGGDAPPPTSPPPSGAATATLAVTVIDTQGRFVSGAAVTSPSGSASTDASGVASLAVATGSEQVLSIAKDGFAEQVKPITVPNGRGADALQVMLIARDAAVAIGAIESGGSASGREGVKVTFPAGALVDGAGNAVTGTIQMQMTPLDVAALDAQAFPGAFAGVPTGGVRGDIMSYGTAELLPLKNGQKLQLAAGKSAQIELPIYAAVHQNGAAVAVGETIALWSLNAVTGVWTQEGTGTVVASAASPSGRALRATITHFSWWNGDVSAQMGTVNLTVHVPNPNAPIAAGTLASVTGQVVAGSGPSWVAQITLQVDVAAALRVPSNATTHLVARVDLPTQVCAGTADVSPAPNATINATISAVCFTLPVPTIVSPVDGTVTNSSDKLTVTATIAGGQPDTLDVLVDGTLDPNQHLGFAQFFYTTPLNLGSLSEGAHTLVARTTRQGVTRDSDPVTITIDRTPPQATAISPASTVEVSRDTVFTVDFSEPVFAGRPDLALTDVVKLSVLAAGQSTPVEVPITASFENGQNRVKVLVNQVLPIGVASLSWGGLRDGARNTVAGTVAASWNVARTANLGAFGLFNNSRLAITTNSAGTVFALRQRAGDGNVEASRFDGTGLVPIGPVINDRTVGGDAFGSIAADANGQVFAAFVQAEAAGTVAEVMVKRFDANANAWVTLVAPFPSVGVNVNPAIAPKLALNAAGQPVLVFVDFTPSLVLRGFRFDGAAWVDLGSLSGDFFSGPQSMALDANGNPIVALLDNGALRVVRNTGTAWVAMGAVLDSVPNGTQSVGEPSLAIDGAGQPWVAWSHFPTPPVNLVRFDGATFVPVPVTPTPTHGHPVLTFVNGDPVLAIGDDSTEVRRLRNGAWEPPVPVAFDGRGPIVTQPSNGALILGVTGNGNGVGTLLKVAFP